MIHLIVLQPEHYINCTQLDGVTELPNEKDVIALTSVDDECIGDDEVAFELA